MKALILQHSEGQYDEYYVITDHVFLVPDDFDPEAARKAYLDAAKADPSLVLTKRGEIRDKDLRRIVAGWPDHIKSLGHQEVSFVEYEP